MPYLGVRSLVRYAAMNVGIPQQLPRSKKTKLPPKRLGKSRVKVNRDADPLPVQNVPSQSSSHESSCPDQSIISVSGEIVVSSAVCTVLGSEEISSVAKKEDLSPLNLVTVGESQQMEVLLDNVANKTTGSSDYFVWLDYVEAETVIGENASISQKEDAPEVQESENKDERMTVFPEQASCETSGPVCFPQEYQNLRPDFSSSDVWEDEAPIQVQNSEVLLLPYKEESSSVGDIMGRDGEGSSSFLGGGPEESEFDGFGGLFNEPEVVAGPAPRPSSSGDVEAVILIRSNSESDPDEVDDTDSPVSVESCLAHFIKPELLSDENAWHCENCSKILQRQKKKSKKQARILSDLYASGSHDESNHASNSCSCTLKVSSRGNGDIKSDKNVESSVSHVQHDTELHNGELQSSSLQQACKEESCSDSAADSCTSGNVQRDSPMFNNDDNDSEESSDKETELESMRVNRDATKRVLIYKAPPVLTIHLKRFSQDARGRLSKLNGHVDFRETLDLRPYMDPRCINEEKYEYQLVGIVEHSGTMRGGHYVAYVRGGQKNREKVDHKENENVNSMWYHASDAYVREVSLDEVLRCEAYILFYERN
ncbi:hypothetical protein KIW84_053006 [Lathyrus oleraceus]|uniref:USP domain-containing protein n=1 Tax=Pisum sativum TaxID=3888 RepID=A0A9D4WRM2_PEA|nr:hypothetical protein KIW84_053006 [Pisum sativum]